MHGQLDSLFTILESNHRSMGGVSVRQGGRLLYHRAFGMRDSTAAGWIRSDEATRFRVGSVTKPFTAVLIYQLVDEGRLSLETRLSTFFPEIPGSDAIAVRDLLAHTSGLNDFTRGIDPFAPLDRAAILSRIGAAAPQFPAGTQRRYSNSNYLLLGWIVEALRGKPYGAVLRENLTDRIGLERTVADRPVTPEENEARAYYWDDSRWQVQPDHRIENAGGAGAIASTPDDLTLFLARLFHGGLISPASLAEMTTGFDDGTRVNGKGLGPFTVEGRSRGGFAHDGSIGAHCALVGYLPEDSLAVALTVNGHNFPINRVFFLVWDVLVGNPVEWPSFEAAALEEGDSQALAGVYSAAEYGLTMTVRATGEGLEAQTDGQDAFPLTHVGKRRFLFDPAGIMLEFDPPANGLSPRFTLFQQRAAVPLLRIERAP